MNSNMKIWIRGPRYGEGATLREYEADCARSLADGLFAALGLADDDTPGDIIAGAPGVTFTYPPSGRHGGVADDYDIVIEVKDYDNSFYEIPPLMTLLEVSDELDAELICSFDVPDLGLVGIVSAKSGKLLSYTTVSMEV